MKIVMPTISNPPACYRNAVTVSKCVAWRARNEVTIDLNVERVLSGQTIVCPGDLD